jgi:hypothetical protein
MTEENLARVLQSIVLRKEARRLLDRAESEMDVKDCRALHLAARSVIGKAVQLLEKVTADA